MTRAAIHAQGRRVGLMVLCGPILAGAVVALAGWFAAESWPPSQAMTLVNWLAQVFVIATGICAAVALTGDPLIELHESTPTGFRQVQLLRAGLVALSGLVGAVLMFFPLHALPVWPRDEGWASVASPAGAVVIMIVVALVAAAFAGTAATTTIAVVAAWTFLAMLWDPYVLPLPQQRGIPLIISAGLLVAVWHRLANAERNIAKVVAA
ncbi:hypothetical protein [Georgenia deserti]|uniref:ABC transporter permease n=1 Tax=Georgenia deserti TaxID=2093781 RepID=A0ABW4L5V1_9MICO